MSAGEHLCLVVDARGVFAWCQPLQHVWVWIVCDVSLEHISHFHVQRMLCISVDSTAANRLSGSETSVTNPPERALCGRALRAVEGRERGRGLSLLPYCPCITSSVSLCQDVRMGTVALLRGMRSCMLRALDGRAGAF